MGIGTDSREPQNTGSAITISSSKPTNGFVNCNELKRMISLLRKMFWQQGLACFIPIETKKKSTNLEHNKAWLLAESGGGELINAEPHSVHSSFRFNLYSQVELESMNINSSASATVLMVNLDNGWSETGARELKCKRIQSLERSISPVANHLVRFSYSEIVAATGNFSEGRVLGRGALSFVFRGRVGLLRTAVAIKRLNKEDKEASKAFCRELMIVSSLHNPNIVPLVGFCIDPEEGLFLVYRYVSGGSLEHHLHEKKRGAKGSTVLTWSVRYKVALGIAGQLHICIKELRDVLSIETLSPLIFSFLPRKFPSYLAPEYFQHGKVSDKTDVYAFGVVLLELITGRKPIEARRPPGQENLVLWAKPLLQKGKGAIKEILDPQLKYTLKNTNEITRMIQAAAACVSNEESRRPGIDEIAAILGGEEPFYAVRKKSNFSGIVDCYPQLPQSKSEMNGHLALAMLGVSEFEDDDHLYCR